MSKKARPILSRDERAALDLMVEATHEDGEAYEAATGSLVEMGLLKKILLENGPEIVEEWVYRNKVVEEYLFTRLNQAGQGRDDLESGIT